MREGRKEWGRKGGICVIGLYSDGLDATAWPIVKYREYPA